jgi:PBP1b-binding outer membrane lipoprotein LpoB
MKNYLTILTLSLVFAACGGSNEQHDATHETEAGAVPAAEFVTLPDTTVAMPDSLVAVPDSVAAEVDAEG